MLRAAGRRVRLSAPNVDRFGDLSQLALTAGLASHATRFYSPRARESSSASTRIRSISRAIDARRGALDQDELDRIKTNA